MSVSTEVNVMDFAEDFGPTIEPRLRAIGLVDSSGNLDFANFNFDNILNLLDDAATTEYLLSFIDSALGPPVIRSRRVDDDGPNGILDLDHDAGSSILDKWYPITSIPIDGSENPIGISLVLNHYDDGSKRTLDILLGIDYDPIIGSTILELDILVPLFRYDSSISEMKSNFWNDVAVDDRSDSISRIALNAVLSGWNGSSKSSLATGSPSVDSVAISCAFGGNGSALEFRADGFALSDSAPPQFIIIDEWSTGGVIGDILRSMIEQMMQKIKDDIDDPRIES